MRSGVREFRIPITHETIEIADGVSYEGWTFGRTVPGPVIRVREGDQVKVTLVNESPVGHSIAFHSARIPMDVAFKTIGGGDSLEFTFEAADPGVYVVHCGTPPVLMHITQGMYLAIIVDPKEGWGTDVNGEFVLVQSDFYPQRGTDGAPLFVANAGPSSRSDFHVVGAIFDRVYGRPGRRRDEHRGLERRRGKGDTACLQPGRDRGREITAAGVRSVLD